MQKVLKGINVIEVGLSILSSLCYNTTNDYWRHSSCELA